MSFLYVSVKFNDNFCIMKPKQFKPSLNLRKEQTLFLLQRWKGEEVLEQSHSTSLLLLSKGQRPPIHFTGLGGPCKHRSMKCTHNPPACCQRAALVSSPTQSCIKTLSLEMSFTSHVHLQWSVPCTEQEARGKEQSEGGKPTPATGWGAFLVDSS